MHNQRENASIFVSPNLITDDENHRTDVNQINNGTKWMPLPPSQVKMHLTVPIVNITGEEEEPDAIEDEESDKSEGKFEEGVSAGEMIITNRKKTLVGDLNPQLTWYS
jgi:hypothetical protein